MPRFIALLRGVNVGGNNPLKFSITPEQAIEAMIKPTVRGYLPAETAAAHQFLHVSSDYWH